METSKGFWYLIVMRDTGAVYHGWRYTVNDGNSAAMRRRIRAILRRDYPNSQILRLR